MINKNSIIWLAKNRYVLWQIVVSIYVVHWCCQKMATCCFLGLDMVYICERFCLRRCVFREILKLKKCTYLCPTRHARSKNAVSATSDFMQTASCYLERFLKELAGDQCSSLTKGSIYHIKHMYIQPFTTVVDWPGIWCLMEVSTMFYVCRYCVFTW